MSPVSAAKPAASASPTDIPMLIGGQWRKAAESYQVRDPYRDVYKRQIRSFSTPAPNRTSTFRASSEA